jgi:hypothetical protein
MMIAKPKKPKSGKSKAKEISTSQVLRNYDTLQDEHLFHS